jgi:hypothetical protein
MNRSNVKLYNSQVSELLPDFFDSEYPLLVKFLERYYAYTKEDDSISYEAKIKELFDLRDITTTELDALDYLLREIGNGVDHTIFPKEGGEERARLSARLLANFYRIKGTQNSAEQFFKMFFNEDVEVSYPKENIFYLNDKIGGSLIGPESVHFITDNRRYQIFSILLKTGLSGADYEGIYKKFVHPAGFYLATDVSTKGTSSLDTQGEGTDPLETPYVFIESTAHASCTPEYALLTMRETDPVDQSFILSSEVTLRLFDGMSLQRIKDLYGTLATWQAPGSVLLSQEDIYLSDVFDCKDADFTETTIDISMLSSVSNVRTQPDPVPDTFDNQVDKLESVNEDFNIFFGTTRIETIKLGEENISSIQYSNDQIIVGN